MTRKDRWEFAAVVAGCVFGLPLGFVVIDINKPYAAGVSFLDLYWPRVAAFAVVMAGLLIHRFLLYRR
jgi:hypothetical protein